MSGEEEVDYGYGDTEPDYGYGDPDGKDGAGGDVDYGYGDQADYGYGDQEAGADYGYGDQQPEGAAKDSNEEKAPRHRTARRNSCVIRKDKDPLAVAEFLMGPPPMSDRDMEQSKQAQQEGVTA